MNNRNFIEELKYQWKYGGMHIQLIGVNLMVFIFIGLLSVFGRLIFKSPINPLDNFLANVFVLHGDPVGLATHPWGLFTSIFAHFELFHFLFNMLFLFFAGRIFLNYFSGSRLLYTYLLGGVMGGVIEILAHLIFPGLEGQSVFVVGASGSIMAIFIAIAFYRPNTTVNLFGVFPIRLIFLALLFVIQDFLSLDRSDGVAHFAHLGGALIGFLSVQNLNESKNVITSAEGIGNKFVKFFKNSKGKASKSRMKAQRGGAYKKNYNTRSDEEYNQFKKSQQEELDRILDKISKAGYDSLTKKEKQLLFDQSRNGK
ncbi:MAG: rhomboid family intramembrane serine protease [Lishizhenia sp.]